MFKLNLFLLALLMVCAFSVVTSQHKARRLYAELRQEEKIAFDLAEAHRKLLLEQSAYGLHSRIEREAAGRLGMVSPDATDTVVVTASGEVVSSGSEQK